MSLLIANGHPDARRYPVGLLWAEAELVEENVNGMLATEMVLLQSAVSSVLSKDGAKEFQKAIRRLTEG